MLLTKENFEPMIRWHVLLFVTVVCSVFIAPAYGLNLKWNPPDGEEEVLDYNVYYKTGECSSPYNSWDTPEYECGYVDDTDIYECSLPIDGLSEARNLHFVVTAVYDSGAESIYSKQVCWNSVEACCPYIYELASYQYEPGEVVRIIGSDFGTEQNNSSVSIGKRVFGPGHKKIKVWTNTEIWIKLPRYRCRWFKNGDYKTQNIWITVDRGNFFVDSNDVWLDINKTYDCR